MLEVLEDVSLEPDSFLMPLEPMLEDSSLKERRKRSFRSLALSMSYDRPYKNGSNIFRTQHGELNIQLCVSILIRCSKLNFVEIL